MPTKVSGYINISNYYDSKGSNETLNMVGVRTPLWKKASIMAGIGCDVNYNHQTQTSVIKPAAEVKFNQQFNDYTGMQLRFREIEGSEQYRVAFGANYKIDKNWSIYGSLHFTAKDNHEEWKCNTGGWLGCGYKFKNGVGLAVEVQQNLPLDGNTNAGDVLTSFNDGNKMINAMLTIPLK